MSITVCIRLSLLFQNIKKNVTFAVYYLLLYYFYKNMYSSLNLYDYYISIDVGMIFQIFHPSPEESLADPFKGIQKRDSGI